MEAIYYDEIKSLNRAQGRLSKALELIALATRENTNGLRDHVDRCEKDTSLRISNLETKLDGNTTTTDKISKTQDALAGEVSVIAGWAKPKINAEQNAEKFWKMAGDALSAAHVHWVFKVFAVCAALGITYLFGGKTLVAWLIGKIVGG